MSELERPPTTELSCYTQGDIMNFLRAQIKASGLNQKEYAARIKVYPTFLNEVLAGRRFPSDKMMKRFGWQKTTVWLPVAPDVGAAE